MKLLVIRTEKLCTVAVGSSHGLQQDMSSALAVMSLTFLSSLALGTSDLRMPRVAQEILENLKQDFDMNIEFQLRKLGIKQNSDGELEKGRVWIIKRAPT